MKKVFLILVVLLCSVMLFATESEGSWTSTKEDGVDKNGDTATMKVTFDLDGNGEGVDKNEHVKIGFSEEPVTSLESYVEGQSTAELKIESGVGVLSEDRYIFWQISSSNAMAVKLSWDEKMGGVVDANNKLAWEISTELPDNQATNGDKVESGNFEGEIVLDRTDMKNFKYGTVGSQKLIIETAPLTVAAIDNYSGTLRLTVTGK